MAVAMGIGTAAAAFVGRAAQRAVFAAALAVWTVAPAPIRTPEHSRHHLRDHAGQRLSRDDGAVVVWALGGQRVRVRGGDGEQEEREEGFHGVGVVGCQGHSWLYTTNQRVGLEIPQGARVPAYLYRLEIDARA